MRCRLVWMAVLCALGDTAWGAVGAAQAGVLGSGRLGVLWVLLWPAVVWASGARSPRFPEFRVRTYRTALAGACWAAGLVVFFAVTADAVARAFVCAAGGSAVWAEGVRRIVARVGRGSVRVLLVGSAEGCSALAAYLRSRGELGVAVVGYVSPDGWVDDGLRAAGLPCLGSVASIGDVLRELPVDEVVLLSGVDGTVMEKAVEQGKVVRLVRSDRRGKGLLDLGPVVFETRAFGPQDSGWLVLKRLLDVVLAAVLLATLLPVMGAVAAAVRLTSPGPALFRQARTGWHGRVFTLYKFRTMVPDAEEQKRELLHLSDMSGPVFKLKDDPRITPVGRVLRRLSLDELPQLWNVLRGDMSLVGPRPLPVEEAAALADADQRRHAFRPGITGLWQVSGRSRLRSTEQLVAKDLEYVGGWSLWKDMVILLRTIPEVLRGGGW